jgi:hypothetical protein
LVLYTLSLNLSGKQVLRILKYNLFENTFHKKPIQKVAKKSAPSVSFHFLVYIALLCRFLNTNKYIIEKNDLPQILDF